MKKSLIAQPYRYSVAPPLNYQFSSLEQHLPATLFTHENPALFEYTITNAIVSPFGLVFKNGTLASASIYYMHRQSANVFTFYKNILLGRKITVHGPAILFHHPWFENYYHWFSEMLPRLYLLRHYLSNFKVLVPAALKPFHRQLLELFDIKQLVEMREGAVYQVKGDLKLTDFPANTFGYHHPQTMSDMSAFLAGAAGVIDALPNKKLYALRGHTAKRRCHNEDDVILYMTRNGFEIVDSGSMTIKEQIQLFRQTKLVAGVHGSSFVNGVFMPAGGCIIDLIQEEHRDLCYQNMAGIQHVNYAYLRQKGMGHHHFRDDDLLVDIPLLEKTMGALGL